MSNTRVHEVPPKTYARLHGVHYNTVYYWIQEGVIPCRRERLHVRHRYYIPLNAVPPVLKPGREPKHPPTPLLTTHPQRTERFSQPMSGSNLNWDKLNRKRIAAKEEAKKALANRVSSAIMEEQ